MSKIFYLYSWSAFALQLTTLHAAGLDVQRVEAGAVTDDDLEIGVALDDVAVDGGDADDHHLRLILVFALYTVPLIVTILAVMIGNIVCTFYFGYKMFDKDWFERTITAYGLESGVLATGLMLLRVVDPKFETTGLMLLRVVDPKFETTGHESGAASAALCYPWSLPYVMFAPALAIAVRRCKELSENK